jgi:hypothetical protein
VSQRSGAEAGPVGQLGPMPTAGSWSPGRVLDCHLDLVLDPVEEAEPAGVRNQGPQVSNELRDRPLEQQPAAADGQPPAHRFAVARRAVLGRSAGAVHSDPCSARRCRRQPPRSAREAIWFCLHDTQGPGKVAIRPYLSDGVCRGSALRDRVGPGSKSGARFRQQAGSGIGPDHDLPRTFRVGEPTPLRSGLTCGNADDLGSLVTSWVIHARAKGPARRARSESPSIRSALSAPCTTKMGCGTSPAQP